MSMTTPIYMMNRRFRLCYMRVLKRKEGLPEWMAKAMDEEFALCKYFGIAGHITDFYS